MPQTINDKGRENAALITYLLKLKKQTLSSIADANNCTPQHVYHVAALRTNNKGIAVALAAAAGKPLAEIFPDGRYSSSTVAA